MSIPPELTAMPDPPRGPAALDWRGPVLTLGAITRGLGMEPTEAAAFGRVVESLVGADNEAELRMALQQHMRDRQMDPQLRQELLRRSLAYYRATAPPAGQPARVRGITPDSVQMRQTMGRKMRKAERLVLDLRKDQASAAHAGEGSRGGHIIGHTRSGHPIYALHISAAAHNSTVKRPFTQQDHDDAASLHSRSARSAEKDGRDNEATYHRHMAEAHDAAAESSDHPAGGPARQYFDGLARRHAEKAYESARRHLIYGLGKSAGLAPRDLPESGTWLPLAQDARLDIQKSVASLVGTGALQDLLADLQAMREAYQALHWAAEGPSAYGDHLLFGRLYDGLVAQVDEVAEKLVGVTRNSSTVNVVQQVDRMAQRLDPGAHGTVAGMLAVERTFCQETVPAAKAQLLSQGELSEGLDNLLQGLVDVHEGNVYLLQQRQNGVAPGAVLTKAGGPYIGPRGGKWADPQHTRAWSAFETQHAAMESTPAADQASRKAKTRAGHQAAAKAHEDAAAKYKRAAQHPDFAGDSATDIRNELTRRASRHAEKAREHSHLAGARKKPAGAEKESAPADKPSAALAAKPAKKEEGTGPAPARKWAASVTEHGLPADTQKHHQVEGHYHPERKVLHEHIMSKFLDHVPSVPENQTPTAVVMMGGSGAGKGTILRHVLQDHHDFVNINPDDVKEELPEYQRAINLGHEGMAGVMADKKLSHKEKAQKISEMARQDKGTGEPHSAKDAALSVHEESSDVAGEIHRRAVQGRKNLILDGTGKNAEKYGKKIEELKAAGYHVRLMMPHIDMGEAKKRVKERADRSGRYVPDEFVEEAHHVIPGNFERLAAKAHEAVLFNNNKKPPDPVWTMNNVTGQHDIKDHAFVDDFKRTGIERHQMARQKGWMKSGRVELDELDLWKAQVAKKPVSVPLDRMLARFEQWKGEGQDSSTGLEDADDVVRFRQHLKGAEARKSWPLVLDLAKGEPKGGAYHRRVTDPETGRHRYIYSPDAYAKRPDAHVDGQQVLKNRMAKDIHELVGGGCRMDALAPVVRRYPDGAVSAMIRDMVERGDLLYKDGLLCRKG